MNIQLENYGIVNIVDHIENKFIQDKPTLIRKLKILMHSNINFEDKKMLEEILQLINQNEMVHAQKILSKLSTFAKTVMKELSLSLLIDILKSNIR